MVCSFRIKTGRAVVAARRNAVERLSLAVVHQYTPRASVEGEESPQRNLGTRAVSLSCDEIDEATSWHARMIQQREPFAIIFASDSVPKALHASTHWPRLARLMSLPEPVSPKNMQTYLVRGRGYTEAALLLSSLPYVVGSLANGSGGLTSDWLVRRYGLRTGRRAIGVFGLGFAAAFMTAPIVTTSGVWTLVFLSLAYAGILAQQPNICAVCLDTGKRHAGTVFPSP